MSLLSPKVSASVNSLEPPLPPATAVLKGLVIPPVADEAEEPVALIAAAAALAAAAAEQTMVHLGQPAPTPSRSIRVEAAPPRQEPCFNTSDSCYF